MFEEPFKPLVDETSLAEFDRLGGGTMADDDVEDGVEALGGGGGGV